MSANPTVVCAPDRPTGKYSDHPCQRRPAVRIRRCRPRIPHHHGPRPCPVLPWRWRILIHENPMRQPFLVGGTSPMARSPSQSNRSQASGTRRGGRHFDATLILHSRGVLSGTKCMRIGSDYLSMNVLFDPKLRFPLAYRGPIAPSPRMKTAFPSFPPFPWGTPILRIGLRAGVPRASLAGTFSWPSLGHAGKKLAKLEGELSLQAVSAVRMAEGARFGQGGRCHIYGRGTKGRFPGLQIRKGGEFVNDTVRITSPPPQSAQGAARRRPWGPTRPLNSAPPASPNATGPAIPARPTARARRPTGNRWFGRAHHPLRSRKSDSKPPFSLKWEVVTQVRGDNDPIQIPRPAVAGAVRRLERCRESESGHIGSCLYHLDAQSARAKGISPSPDWLATPDLRRMPWPESQKAHFLLKKNLPWLREYSCCTPSCVRYKFGSLFVAGFPVEAGD